MQMYTPVEYTRYVVCSKCQATNGTYLEFQLPDSTDGRDIIGLNESATYCVLSRGGMYRSRDSIHAEFRPVRNHSSWNIIDEWLHKRKVRKTATVPK